MDSEFSEIELSRRSFLTRIIGFLGGLIGASIAAVGGGTFLSPLWQKNEESWTYLGRAKSFSQKIPVKVDFTLRKRDAWMTIESRSSAWIVTEDGKNFTAYDPKCTHLGCPFRWSDEKKQFLCPCHSAVFGLDGKVISGPPPRPLDRYPVKVEGGKLYILPQTVKTEGIA